MRREVDSSSPTADALRAFARRLPPYDDPSRADALETAVSALCALPDETLRVVLGDLWLLAPLSRVAGQHADRRLCRACLRAETAQMLQSTFDFVSLLDSKETMQ